MYVHWDDPYLCILRFVKGQIGLLMSALWCFGSCKLLGLHLHKQHHAFKSNSKSRSHACNATANHAHSSLSHISQQISLYVRAQPGIEAGVFVYRSD